MNPQDLNNAINAVNILSFLIGYENLIENREQSAHNDIQVSNDRQAQYLLQEIKALFQEQNEILQRIIIRLERLEMMHYGA